MSWTKWAKRGSPFAVAIAAVSYYVYDKASQEKNILHASWTTNFEPSVKWEYNWDKREPGSLVKPKKKENILETEKDVKDAENELKKQTATATRHLIFIRHGQYNLDGEKDKDRYLTALGKQQAEFAGQRLKDLGFQYTYLVSSTMTRAIQTADIISKYIPDVERSRTELLNEGAPIPPEPPIGSWRPEKQFFEDGARIEAAFRQHFHRASPSQLVDSHEVIVCHANVIRYFVCRALQFPPEAWLRIGLNHASITWMTIRPSGRVSIRHLGDSGYIPADKLTST